MKKRWILVLGGFLLFGQVGFGMNHENLIQFKQIGLEEDMLIQLVNKDNFEVTLDGLNKIQEAGISSKVVQAYTNKIMGSMGMPVITPSTLSVMSNPVDEAKSPKKIMSETSVSEIKEDSSPNKIDPAQFDIPDEVEYFLGAAFVRFNVFNDDGNKVMFVFGKTEKETHYLFKEEGKDPVYRKAHVEFLDRLFRTLDKKYKADSHMDNPFWQYKKNYTGEFGRAPTRNYLTVDSAYGSSPYGTLSFRSDEGHNMNLFMRPEFFEVIKTIAQANVFQKSIKQVPLGETMPEPVAEKVEADMSEVEKRMAYMKQQLAEAASLMKELKDLNGEADEIFNHHPNLVNMSSAQCMEAVSKLKGKTNYPVGVPNFRYIGSEPHLVVVADDLSAGTDPFKRNEKGQLITAITHPKLIRDPLTILIKPSYDGRVWIAKGWMTIAVHKGVKKGFLRSVSLMDIYYMKINYENIQKMKNMSDQELKSYLAANYAPGLPKELRAN